MSYCNGNLPSTVGIVFDLDGTLIDTAEIKAQAFGKLFSHYGPEIENAVIQDHLRSEGISRFVKFKRWYQEFLGLDYTTDFGIELSRQYNMIIADQIACAPWMPGALDFVREWHTRIPLYLASATPHADLQQILAMRSMTDFFRSAWGFPTLKHVALQHIITELQAESQDILMVGDAVADYNESLAAGVPFCRFIRSMSAWPPHPELYPIITNLNQLPRLFTFGSSR